MGWLGAILYRGACVSAPGGIVTPEKCSMISSAVAVSENRPHIPTPAQINAYKSAF